MSFFFYTLCYHPGYLIQSLDNPEILFQCEKTEFKEKKTQKYEFQNESANKLWTGINLKRFILLMKFFFWTLSYNLDYLIQPSNYPKVKKMFPYKGRRVARFLRVRRCFHSSSCLDQAYRADEYRTIFSCNALPNDKKSATLEKKMFVFKALKRFLVKTSILVKYYG